jgi:hypothetical protein
MTKVHDDKFVLVLGKYFGEAEITSFLAGLEITSKPKLKRGDSSTHLSNQARGVELAFEDSEALDVIAREYPDGALVLANISLYIKSSTFQAYKGELPFGIESNDTRQTLKEKLGTPAEDDAEMGIMRWDSKDYCVFADVDSNGNVLNIALQLPLK